MRPIRTFDFIVVLKKTTTKMVDLMSVLMLALAVLFFIYHFVLQFATANNSLTSKNGLLLVWILGIVGWVLFSKKNEKKGIAANYRFALMLAGWGWFMLGVWYLAIIYLVAAFLERPLKVAPEYAFDETEIVFNSFPQKKYNWSEVSNVILKFGMLTIDLKNNKIIQGEVNDDVPLQVETEFNAFCKQQLNRVV
jgi:hypothetical protein